MKLTYTLAALAVTTLAANAATMLYSSDFQSDTHDDATPAGWSYGRAFGPDTSVEDGVNDRALIALGAGNYTTRLELTVAIEPNTTYTLSLKGGFYSSTAGTGTFKYSIGTGTAAAYTQLSSETTSSLTQTGTAAEYHFGSGSNAALTDLVFTTGSTVSGDDLVVHVRAEGATFQGIDNVVLTAVPEPSSAALLGLSGLALILRRRK